MAENKYITVLDFEVGKVFQYKLPKRRPFEDIGYENYITNKGHRLNNIEWMVHEDSEIYTQTKEGDIVITN